MKLTKIVFSRLLEDMQDKLRQECHREGLPYPETTEQLFGFGSYDKTLPSLRHGLEAIAEKAGQKFSPKYLYSLTLKAKDNDIEITKTFYKTLFFKYIGYKSLTSYLTSGKFDKAEMAQQRRHLLFDRDAMLRDQPLLSERFKQLEGVYRLLYVNTNEIIVQCKIVFDSYGTARIYQPGEPEVIVGVESDANFNLFLAEITPFNQKNFYYVFFAGPAQNEIMQGVVATTNPLNKPVAMRVFMIRDNTDFEARNLTFYDPEYWALNQSYSGLASKINMWEDLLVCSQVSDIRSIVSRKGNEEYIYLENANLKLDKVDSIIEKEGAAKPGNSTIYNDNAVSLFGEALRSMNMAMRRGMHNETKIESFITRCDKMAKVMAIASASEHDLARLKRDYAVIKKYQKPAIVNGSDLP